MQNSPSADSSSNDVPSADSSSKDVSSSAFTCLNDLKNSSSYEDQLVVKCLLDLLNQVTDQKEPGQCYIVSKKNESLDNQKYILDNWVTFRQLFDLQNRLKRNQKFVSQVIKYAINKVNDKYQFDKPIKMSTRQKSQLYRDELGIQKETKVTFTEIRL